MNKEETIMLNDFLKNESVVELMSDEMRKLSKKVDIMTKQALLNEQFQKDYAELAKELENLNKKEN